MQEYRTGYGVGAAGGGGWWGRPVGAAGWGRQAEGVTGGIVHAA